MMGVARAPLRERFTYLPVDLTSRRVWATELNRQVERSPQGVENPTMVSGRLPDENGVGRVRPGSIDPGRGVREDEVVLKDHTSRRLGATGGCCLARRHP